MRAATRAAAWALCGLLAGVEGPLPAAGQEPPAVVENPDLEPPTADSAPADPLVGYNRCLELALAPDQSAGADLETCRVAAAGGIPGAQFILGQLLASGGEPEKMEQAAGWLAAAAASGHPGALFAVGMLHLSGVGVEQDTTRAGQFIRRAYCFGFPQAVDLMAEQGIAASEVDCSDAPPPAGSLEGDWRGTLVWRATSTPLEGPSGFEVRVVIAAGEVQVFHREGDDWSEVKPGSFTLEVLDNTAVVRSLEAGWDFDGKWVESWTLYLLASAPGRARASFLRTVNNLHVPERFDFARFTAFAEGELSTAPQ